MLKVTINHPELERSILNAARVQRKSVEGLLVDTFAVMGLGDARFRYDDQITSNLRMEQVAHA